MIRHDQIPDEVAKAIYDLFPPGYLEFIGLPPQSIAAAALAAWPLAKISPAFNGADAMVPGCLHLPLPQETKDG